MVNSCFIRRQTKQHKTKGGNRFSAKVQLQSWKTQRVAKKTKKKFRRLIDLISTGKALYKQRITASGNVITGDWKTQYISLSSMELKESNPIPFWTFFYTWWKWSLNLYPIMCIVLHNLCNKTSEIVSNFVRQRWVKISFASFAGI